MSSNYVPILAALRTIWGTGYSDLMGYPVEDLTDEYWIPVYNNVTMNSQLRFTNTDSVNDATVMVYIGTQSYGPYTVKPLETQRYKYPVDDGPVRVVSTNHVPILAALRTIWDTGYSDLMGYPVEDLTQSALTSPQIWHILIFCSSVR